MLTRTLVYQLLLAFSFSWFLSDLQAQFVDDFSDGDFTTSPAWTGNTGVFTVNANFELQLNASAAGTSYLQSDHAMPTLNGQEWRFWVKQSFSPSGSNFSRVYLVSDQPDLTGSLNGYFLQFGESGSNDAIELFEQSSLITTSVARGTNGLISTSFEVGVKVTRDAAGTWTIMADPAGGTNYAFQASGVNTTHSSSAHLGVACEYTISNATNFHYDDFYAGPMVVDVDPPTIVNVTVVDADNILVTFNEAVEQTSAEDENNYDIQPFLSAATALRDAVDLSLVELTLTASMTNGSSYNLIVTGVEDLSGNAMPATSFMFDYIVPDTAEYRDVVINEIMADPSPPVSLPDAEFVELHNTHPTKSFDLDGWTYSDGSSSTTLTSYLLGPGEFVLLVDAGQTTLFSAFTNVLGVSSWPSLNNAGDDLSIQNSQGTLIDEVTYDDSWYDDPVKDDGGWTLEQINPNTPCSGISNWSASVNLNGGTPETTNSINNNTPDTDPPILTGIAVLGPTSIRVSFNEALDLTSVGSASYVIAPMLSVLSASGSGTNSIDLLFSSPMVAQTVYELTVDAVTDCAGNPMGNDNSGLFGLPETAIVGDVVINELLFDPISGGSDYVELYNTSEKIIDLSTLFMANEENGQIDNITQITSSSVILLPQDYVLLTEDPAFVASEYPGTVEEKVFLTDLPSYNNGEGTVALLDVLSTELDIFRYTDDLHFALLVDDEGVSLERVDPNRPSSDDSNWQSAAETEGFGTPGYRNSQFSETPESTGEITIEPAIFSPDNDGFQDLLTIAYSFGNPGVVGTVRIHDLAGRPIRTLLENELLSTSGAVSWDGIMDDNNKARIGAYVVLFEVFNLNGGTEVFQETITLAHQL